MSEYFIQYNSNACAVCRLMGCMMCCCMSMCMCMDRKHAVLDRGK